MSTFSLTSPAFDDGGPIPEQYGYKRRNVNPPLSIAGVPSAAESLALLVDDPDAMGPAGNVWDHWAVWNVPPETESIPEGWRPVAATEGTNDFDERGYGGPSPPDRPHTYRFRLFALDTTLDLDPSARVADVEAAAADHRLAEAALTGTYDPV
ncbi:YbhB/YbcL family Raf kinase inhibitor-like protein [Haloferacaceae archaeon DSL9]